MRISKYFWIINMSFPVKNYWSLSKNEKWLYKELHFMYFFFGKYGHIYLPYWFKKYKEEL